MEGSVKVKVTSSRSSVLVSSSVSIVIVRVSLVIVRSGSIVCLVHLSKSPIFYVEISSAIIALVSRSRSIDLEVVVIEVANRRRESWLLSLVLLSRILLLLLLLGFLTVNSLVLLVI